MDNQKQSKYKPGIDCCDQGGFWMTKDMHDELFSLVTPKRIKAWINANRKRKVHE